ERGAAAQGRPLSAHRPDAGRPQPELGSCPRRPTPSCGLRTLRSSSSSVAPIALLSTLPASSRSSVLARLATWTLFLDTPFVDGGAGRRRIPTPVDRPRPCWRGSGANGARPGGCVLGAR